MITCVNLTAFLPLANGLVSGTKTVLRRFRDIVLLQYVQIKLRREAFEKGITRVPVGDELFVCLFPWLQLQPPTQSQIPSRVVQGVETRAPFYSHR